LVSRMKYRPPGEEVVPEIILIAAGADK
jgi:hypothetical protein